MSSYQATMFTTTYCASCQTLKRWLDGQGVEYQTVNLETEPARQAEILKKTGQFQVPVLIVVQSDGTETVIVGNQFEQIRRALNLKTDQPRLINQPPTRPPGAK